MKIFSKKMKKKEKEEIKNEFGDINDDDMEFAY